MGTGHILDMLPKEKYDEFEYGLSIFRAFAEKIEDYSFSTQKYEPSSIKTFAYHFKRFEHEHKNLLAHRHLNEHHFMNRVNSKLVCANWVFAMDKNSCPLNSTLAKSFPQKSSDQNPPNQSTCFVPESLENSERYSRFFYDQTTPKTSIGPDELVDLLKLLQEDLPSCVDP